MIYQWHKSAWNKLRKGIGEHHPTLLLHGPAGTGKRHFGEVFARFLLCNSPTEADLPCMTCRACHWFSLGTHPDFRLLTIDALRPQATSVVESQTDDAARSEKKAATQITIEQIRDLQTFLSLSTHRAGGWRVVLIHPAESMNTFAANALLKILEEPPARTVFLLIADELRRLLPTVVSRCRRYPMPGADPARALVWLHEQGVGQPEVLLAQAGGAPLMALANAAEQEDRRRFLDQLSRLANVGAALQLAGAAQKVALPTVVRWLSTWCYDLMAARLAGGRVRYHPDYRKAIETLAARVELDQLLIYQDLLKAAAHSVAHPLNPRLFLEQLLLSYSETIASASAVGHA